MFTLALVFIAAKYGLSFQLMYFGMFVIDISLIETIGNYFKYKASKREKSTTKNH